MDERRESEAFNQQLDELIGDQPLQPIGQDGDLLAVASRLRHARSLVHRSRGQRALRARLLSEFAGRERKMSSKPFLLRTLSVGAFFILIFAGLSWLLSNSGWIPDIAAAPTATAQPATGQPSPTLDSDIPPTAGAAEIAPVGFAPFSGDLAFEWVDGPIRDFYYADVTSEGQVLGRIDFGSIQGGWCDRSADGGVLAFVHENVRSAGAAGFADEPATLQWVALPDITQVHDPLPSMQVMNPPVFSPDGYRLAFSACPADGNCGVYVYDLAAGDLTRVSPYQLAAPILWSPDGSQLAFEVRIGDLPELHVISLTAMQTDFLGRASDPSAPIRGWGRSLPTGVEGVSRCEKAGADLPEPLTLESDSETIRLRMLFSHTLWRTLWVDARIDDLNGAVASSQRVQVWVEQPARVRVLSGPLDGEPGLLWISDGERTRLGEEVRVAPYDPPVVETGTIYPHPLNGMLPTPLSSLLFPSGFAQRGGTYLPVTVETIAGREALVVDWQASWGEVIDRFWVDVITGVVLRQQNHGKDGGGALTSDIQVTAIAYEFDPHPETFNRLAVFPPVYSAGPEDIHSAEPTPAATGEPDTSAAAGEIYLLLAAPGGFENAGLFHFPAGCLVSGAACPVPEPVPGTPGGFGVQPAWSPDGTQMVYGLSALTDEVWEYLRFSNEWIKLDVHYFSGAVWSPDSDWLAGQPIVRGDQSANPIVIVRQDGQGWQEVLADQPGYKSPFGWADWHSILFVNTLDNEVSDTDPFVYSEISLYVMDSVYDTEADPETGKVEVLSGVRTDANSTRFGIPVLSPDRTRFAYPLTTWGTGTTEVVVFDLADRSESSFTFDLPGEISWTPDGQGFLVSAALGYSCEIHLIGWDGNGDRLLYAGDGGGGCQSTWSPDGAYLLVPELARDPGVPRLTVIEIETGESRTVELPDLGVPFEWLQPAWLP